MQQTGTTSKALRIPGMFAVWHRLSILGEMIGSEALIYNPGIFHSFHQAALKNAPLLADAALVEFPGVTSLVDVGCGTGVFAAEFKKRGLRVAGYEYSPRGRRWAQKQGIDVRPFDVSVSDDARLGTEAFDLVLSTEVAEHVPPSLADAFVRFVASCGNRIIFTACQPGGPCKGSGHLNEQHKPYWIARFESLGFRHDDGAADRISAALRKADASYYMHQNMMVFVR